ncbi:SMODS domain-containing nucleotidyltransferase [Polyangium mundeleinium]|uniref:Nucleotidyltransferase n=1 Tax=Polyangium mundeleinium TaxID=2995306 RepID=A0ABT5ESL3_9BACT|nr:nucleotidyltransferase [Polyangium mundeleinium]MDC0744814.1 nucleotidyltransferase [Polyangium mundeleinium]
MELPTYFTDFLQAIRPTDAQRRALRDGHIKLRERLMAFEPLKLAFVTTFLQGSYRRSTAVRPSPGRRSDVDIIVVTRLHENDYTPAEALALFEPFVEKHYKDQYRIQGRSIGIHQEQVDLDLVITSSPPESIMGILPEDDEELDEETEAERNRKIARGNTWKKHSLRIPDRDAKRWEDTHPLAQLAWTREKNGRTSGHFVNVVKAIKWWRYNHQPALNHPKSYPLERIIADCCPDGIRSVAEGVTKTLEAVVTRYGFGKPLLPDHGCHPDVLHRVTEAQFREFYGAATTAARLARLALEAESIEQSATLWRALFGDKFPEPPKDEDEGSRGGFSERSGPSRVGSGRFA